jgi:hypothetical protein
VIRNFRDLCIAAPFDANASGKHVVVSISVELMRVKLKRRPSQNIYNAAPPPSPTGWRRVVALKIGGAEESAGDIEAKRQGCGFWHRVAVDDGESRPEDHWAIHPLRRQMLAGLPPLASDSRFLDGDLPNESMGLQRVICMINIINSNHNAPAPCLGLPPFDGSLQRFNNRAILTFACGKHLAPVSQIAQVPAAAVDASLHRLDYLQTLVGVALLRHINTVTAHPVFKQRFSG